MFADTDKANLNVSLRFRFFSLLDHLVCYLVGLEIGNNHWNSRYCNLENNNNGGAARCVTSLHRFLNMSSASDCAIAGDLSLPF